MCKQTKLTKVWNSEDQKFEFKSSKESGENSFLVSMSKTKRPKSADSSSDDEARFAEAVDPVLHGKLYGIAANGILLQSCYSSNITRS